MCQQGHAIDKEYDDIYYVPENSKFSMITQSVTFNIKGKEQKLNLKPRVTYVLAAPKVAHSALLASFQGKGTRLAQRLLGN